MFHKSFYSTYRYDCPSEIGTETDVNGGMRLHDIIECYKELYDWKCFDNSFDNVSCDVGGSSFYDAYDPGYCIGILLSKYSSILDVFVVKSESKEKGGIALHFNFMSYSKFWDFYEQDRVVFPKGFKNYYDFLPHKRKGLSGSRYKFCGVSYIYDDCEDDRYDGLSEDADIEYTFDIRARCHDFSFVLARDGFYCATMKELRLLVAFDLVDGLCIKDGLIGLTKKAYQEFNLIKNLGSHGLPDCTRYQFFKDRSLVIRGKHFEWNVPVFEYEIEREIKEGGAYYKWPLPLEENCFIDDYFNTGSAIVNVYPRNDFVVKMYKAGFYVDIMSLTLDLLRGWDSV